MKPVSFFFLATIVWSCSTQSAREPVEESSYNYQPTIAHIDGSSITEKALTNSIQKLMDTAKVTGLAIAILNDNKVVYKKAFGKANGEENTELKTGHIMYGASFSKAVFGYLVAQLVNEGIVDLDKPLQEYWDTPIPELPFDKEWRNFKNLAGDDRYKAITARMCLSHSSGLPNWRWITRTGELNRKGKIHFYFDPGTGYSYSGEGIRLLQLAIEEITGKGLEELAQEHIFQPLQMNNTSYVWQERFEGRYCNGHTSDGEALEKDTEDEAGAAGSMETTLDDYALFAQHVLTIASDSSDVTKLMFEANIRIRTKAQFGPQVLETTDENDDIKLSYGLGWGLLKSPFGMGAFKEGHSEGFQHYSIIFPERKTGIILMTNSDNGESIFKALLEIAIGDTYTPWGWENYIPYDMNGTVSR